MIPWQAQNSVLTVVLAILFSTKTMDSRKNFVSDQPRHHHENSAKGTRGKSTMVALSMHFDPREFPNPLLSINETW